MEAPALGPQRHIEQQSERGLVPLSGIMSSAQSRATNNDLICHFAPAGKAGWHYMSPDRREQVVLLKGFMLGKCMSTQSRVLAGVQDPVR